MITHVSILFSVLAGFVIWWGESETLVTEYITQPLDHFGFGSLSNRTFKQKVLLDFTYGPSRTHESPPLLVFFGAEARIESFLLGPGAGPGILTQAASQFHSPLVYIEHRFYGESVPYGSIDLAMLDVEVRGCLTSTQALADFADIIIYLKTKYSIVNSLVIVMGGSYGGMLAAWFRLKYPHIAIGAVASSAPLLNTLEIPLENRFCAIVSRDFRDTSKKCFDHISKSWALIDDIAAQPNGLKKLSQIFKTCRPLLRAYELKDFLAQMYRYVAQYNGRFNRLHSVCDEIAPVSEDNILDGISRATFKLSGQEVCNDISWMAPRATLFYTIDPQSFKAWSWQMCSELLGTQNDCNNDSMFEPHVFNISDHMEHCWTIYGVYPRPNWISTYYGGQELKSALKIFGSNIIFSNGLKDPLSGASILQDISKTIVAINTNQGSHSLDMTVAQHDDPRWLKEQREKELEIMYKWINNTNGGLKMRHFNLISLTAMQLIVHYVLQI